MLWVRSRRWTLSLPPCLSLTRTHALSPLIVSGVERGGRALGHFSGSAKPAPASQPANWIATRSSLPIFCAAASLHPAVHWLLAPSPVVAVTRGKQPQARPGPLASRIADVSSKGRSAHSCNKLKDTRFHSHAYSPTRCKIEGSRAR